MMVFKKYLKLIFIFILLIVPALALAEIPDKKVAFYYGENPPIERLSNFSMVVFEPTSNVDPKKFDTKNRTALAYVSMGEIEQNDSKIPASWIIGKNKAWKSLVVDQTNVEWQKYFLNNMITPLWEKGYRGFFLDTLDSYQLANLNSQQQKNQQQALVNLIQTIKQKYPNAKIVLNRGFELLPFLEGKIEAVAAESLYSGWDNETQQYVPVSQQERQELILKLNEVKKMGLPVIVIDYVAPNNPNEVDIIYKKINKLGFYPWVTNHDLTAIYPIKYQKNGNELPRKILVFYNGKLNDIDDKIRSLGNLYVTMPLNYLGYVVVLKNINEPLPDISKKEYAGIIIADVGKVTGKEDQILSWELKQIHKKIPLVILNDFGFNLSALRLSKFGLTYPLFPHRAQDISLISKDNIIGYEIAPAVKPESFIPIAIKKGRSLITFHDELGNKGDMAALTPWGGYALDYLVVETTSENSSRWVVNPFEFFKKALRLPDAPTPDTTTANGRRIMLVHIDGDSFANRGKWFNGPFVGEIMKHEFLEHYNIPTTVSIIQGEVASNGLYPKLTPELEKIAREIFILPNVEVASHTYSHPFAWEDAAKYKGSNPNPFSLRIPKYHLNIDTEVKGSVDYINKYLAPPGKPCKVFLWSGDADVPEKAVTLTYQLGLSNMNGIGTSLNKYHTSITNVSPLGMFNGPYFEIFAPITNDFEFTDNMSKPYFSIISVIDTFEMTDKPKRLKPIDIYNHFYIVDEVAGIKALHLVYDWALKQSINNMFVSDYTAKVLDFNSLSIAKQDKGWQIDTADKLREFRAPVKLGYPDLEKSINVIGFNKINDSYYIHLGPGGHSFIRLTNEAPKIPFIVDANAEVTNFKRDKNKVHFSLKGYMPLKFTLGSMSRCNLTNGNKIVLPKDKQSDFQNYNLQESKNDFTIECT